MVALPFSSRLPMVGTVQPAPAIHRSTALDTPTEPRSLAAALRRLERLDHHPPRTLTFPTPSTQSPLTPSPSPHQLASANSHAGSTAMPDERAASSAITSNPNDASSLRITPDQPYRPIRPHRADAFRPPHHQRRCHIHLFSRLEPPPGSSMPPTSHAQPPQAPGRYITTSNRR